MLVMGGGEAQGPASEKVVSKNFFPILKYFFTCQVSLVHPVGRDPDSNRKVVGCEAGGRVNRWDISRKFSLCVSETDPKNETFIKHN